MPAPGPVSHLPKPADWLAKSQLIESLTNIEPHPYFVRDFGYRRLPPCAVTFGSGQMDINRTG